MVFIIFSISHNKFPCPVNIKAKVRFKSDVKLMHHLKQKNMETRKLKILLSPAMMFSISSHEKQWRIFKSPCISQFSRSVMSDSLRPHESQYARPPGVHSNSCHPSISSSVVPFSSCPQSLPASKSFPMSQLFTWSGQSIRVSALAPVLLKNTQDWTGWISLQSKGLSRVFSNTTVQKHQFFGSQLKNFFFF